MKKILVSLCCLTTFLLRTSACGAKKSAPTETRPPVNTAAGATAPQQSTDADSM